MEHTARTFLEIYPASKGLHNAYPQLWFYTESPHPSRCCASFKFVIFNIMMIMITRRRFLQILVVFFFLLLCSHISGGSSLVGAESNVICKRSEQEALLSFKQGFMSPLLDPLSSWETQKDCCGWKGVGCDNITGHVISLDLHSSGLLDYSKGEFVHSLLDLPYLRHLDLSLNDFNHIQIPELLGSLQDLEHLNLSKTNFMGLIPNRLGNLSRLQFLDLSGSECSMRAKNLNWVHGLSSLKVLILDGLDLYMVARWLDSINMLPSLLELSLSSCRLAKPPQSLPYVNFTSLQILDLSLNNFKSSIPDWLFDVSQSLVYLNFSSNMLHGLIPEDFGNMTALTVIDLSKNNLQGPIPATLGPSSLKKLYLSSNQLNGSLEKSLVQFSELVAFDVSSNRLKGNLSEADLLNFTSLQVLDLSLNLLSVHVSSSWTPHFQLEHVGLGSCKMGYRFPGWLRNQKNLLYIDISDAGISDTVPEWFWNLSPKIEYLNLSRNSLRGLVPDLSSKLELSALDLSDNNFQSPLPHFPPNLKMLDLSKASFFGTLSRICELLSQNNSLSYLDLSRNNISGLLPDCWTYGTNLDSLDLSDNILSGTVPSSMGNLANLHVMDLSRNDLSGEVPSSLKDCTSLMFLALSHNRLLGKIPDWIGESLLNLFFLVLHSNAFHGDIPGQLCQLKYLQILDLSGNHLSGEIPRCRCVHNFIGMADLGTVPYYVYPDTVLREYQKRVQRHLRSEKVFISLAMIDLSSNDLSGEFTSLNRLMGLNLANNHLVGAIPSGLSVISELRALDLSQNQLSCTIPPNLADLTFLSFFNVSHNKLSGRIPTGNRFDTFDTTSYIGNDNLCGVPLAKICSRNKTSEDPSCSRKESRDGKEITDVDSDDSEMPFYIISGLGFITGFWGFLGTFLFHRSRRQAYYRFLDNTYDRIYVMVAIRVGRLRRRFQTRLAPEK